jgi:dihydrofolate synthase/folylpolyglutamate synthase
MHLTADSSLDDWLAYLESIHPVGIDMGLGRVQQVYTRLALDWSAATVITVAGTNGKGTTCAFIEQAAMLSKRSVGVYSSPHINIYNERVRINHALLDDAAHTAAFFAIEQARGDVSLTYFEFGTLAGLWLLHQQQLDVVILEVGLGGRLDAINIVDPDIAVITSIGLDHQAFLGDTRELIAIEKAGIMRAHKPVIIGESDPPITLTQAVETHQAIAIWADTDFSYQVLQQQFQYHSAHLSLTTTLPHIPLPNVATAIAVIEQLGWSLSPTQWQQCVELTLLSGRLTVFTEHGLGQSAPMILLDAAHNPHAAEYLVKHIKMMQPKRIFAICGVMKDKDIRGLLQPFVPIVTHWYPCDVNIDRAAQALDIAHCLATDLHVDAPHITAVDHPICGVMDAIKTANEQDLVVIFGSFFTLSDFFARANQLSA